MSAIAGFWNRSGSPAEQGMLRRMLDALKLYGPDATAGWTEGPAAMGLCAMRLPPAELTADFTEGQPVSFANGRLHLVADLRLDNRDELADSLSLRTSDASACTDADMLARAYGRWGIDCVDHILGDFSFAVWDRLERRWFLARDASGSLPLFYWTGGDRFAFASMPLGLLALPYVPCRVNEEWIQQMLELVYRPMEDLHSSTFFSDLRRVPAGHYVVVGQDREDITRWWNPTQTELRLGRPEEYHEALREQLDRAVSRRLRGVGDVASYLSGGLDSSSVTATAARLQAERGARVVAYTSVPQVPADADGHNRFSDERHHAAAVAQMYPNVEHILITSQGRAPWASLPADFSRMQQPVMNLCNQSWLLAIQEDARARGLRVILSGTLGNQTISYTGLESLSALAASAHWPELLTTLAELHKRRGMSWKSLGARTLMPWIPRALHRRITAGAREVAWSVLSERSLLHPDRRAERRTLPQPSYAQASADSVALRLELILRSDQAAVRLGTRAAFRLDERDPTGDRRLMEFCLRVPAREYLRGGMPSALIREGLADRLPAVVRDETRKGTQGTDWHVEAGRDLQRLSALIADFSTVPEVNALVDLPKLRSMVEAWPASGWSEPEIVSRYRQAFLRALSAAAFVSAASRYSRDRDMAV